MGTKVSIRHCVRSQRTEEGEREILGWLAVLMTGHSQVDVYMGYRMCLIDVLYIYPLQLQPSTQL